MSVELAEKLRRRVDEALRRGRLEGDDDRLWLGLGFESVPGKPFQWAWNRERAAIREHLRRRLGRFGQDELALARLESRISRIQERIHRTHPTYQERQEAWRRRQRPRPAAPEAFSKEELERLCELFEGANDPVTCSIARKARALMEKYQ